MSDERKFLHDVSSPLATLFFLVDSTLENLKSRPEANAEDIKQLEQCYGLLERVKTMLQERREILIKRGEPRGGEQ